MNYRLIGDKDSGYSVYLGSPFSEFDASAVFVEIFNKLVGTSYSVIVVSERQGQGARKESLLEIKFNNSTSKFYVYCFQTEGGGRFEDEARVQWRDHAKWTPDLQDFSVCNQFAHELSQADPDLSNKECYVFAFYKRNATDSDVLISAIYPPTAKDKEILTTSPSSIQYLYSDIQRAYINGASSTSKGEGAPLIVHFHPSKLIWYMINRDRLHMASIEEFNRILESTPTATQDVDQQELDSLPRNKIIYGAPGIGKSYILKEQAQALTSNSTRVTFHSSYTYQNFIGAYRPTPVYKAMSDDERLFKSDKRSELSGEDKREPLIDYSFSPGPLLTVLVQALKNSGSNYLLVIEEINRANVSAVFGDFFQLLDRNSAGESDYEIEPSPDVRNYLVSQGIPGNALKFPRNLFIWATMNSADQGVMPLDAAFKRRWSFEYLPLDQNSSAVAAANVNFQGQTINWNNFRNAVNERLKALGVSEDKLIGPFFLKATELNNQSAIKNKLLLYLRDDVVRHNAQSLFKKMTFSDIVKAYDEGQEVFNGVIIPAPVTLEEVPTSNTSNTSLTISETPSSSDSRQESDSSQQ